MDKETFCLYLSRFLQVANLEGMTALDKLPPMFAPMIEKMLGGKNPADLLRESLLGQAGQLTPEHMEWIAHGTQPTRPD